MDETRVTLPAAAFRTAVPIRFSHSDPAGIVYFPNYFDMFNGLVEDWFDQRLGLNYAELLLSRRFGLPAVHAACDFRRPSRMGDTLTLGLLIERIGGKSLSLRIPGLGPDGELRLSAKLVLATTSLETNRAIPIPDDLRTVWDHYRSACLS